MGVINATPDSFYGGSRCTDTDAAVARATVMDANGAAILDIGGESTRPGADSISIEEEARRVMPIIMRLTGMCSAALSIDTRKPAIARAALDAGVHIVNDVSAGADPEMFTVVREYNAGIVLMHMHGTPATMQTQPLDAENAMETLLAFFQRRIDAAVASGISPACIVLDPGLGFGKTARANERIVRDLPALTALGFPIMVGASRKWFIGARTGGDPETRLAGTLAAHVLAFSRGARIIRTHDVAATRDALLVAAGIELDQSPGGGCNS